MAVETIKQILKDHSVEYIEIKGYIVALEDWNGIDGSSGINFIDMTSWSRKQIFDWLGY